MSKCASSLPLPHWFPAALSLGIAIFSCIAVLIAYCIHQHRLRQTFYGIMDEMEEEVKQREEEAEVLGNFDGEVKVIQSMEKIDPHSIARTPGSQVKVMVRRRRPAGSTKPTPTSRELLSSLQTSNLRTTTPSIECDFKYIIQADRNGFAETVLETLKPLIVEEVYRARKSNPTSSKQLPSEDETRIGEYIVGEMRTKLEGLTCNNPWICHGRILSNNDWVVNGHENLLDAHTDLTMSVKVTIESPFSIVLIGYSLKKMGSSGSCLTPAPATIASKDKLHSSALIDSTPHATDPLTPSKHSKASHSSVLKRCKTAEPIIKNPTAGTPVTKIVTVAPATVLSPGRPGTTVIPRKSETKKPVVVTPAVAEQTPKPPPTPRRTPPKATSTLPTPAPTLNAAPTPILQAKGNTVTPAKTPKARTPVLRNGTTTSVIPSPIGATTTTQIPTTKTQTGPSPILLTTTTVATTQAITPKPKTPVSKTPKPAAAASKKKTKSDDTQISAENPK